MYEKMLYEIPEWDGKFEDNKKYLCSSGSSFEISLVLTGDVITTCYHSGECSYDIENCMLLPEVKAQLDALSEEELNKWWEEFFCDDTNEEHANATDARKKSWLLFDMCAFAVDGYCYEAQGGDLSIGMDISDIRQKLGWWWVLEDQRVTPPTGWYRFSRAGHGAVEFRTMNNRVVKYSGAQFELLD